MFADFRIDSNQGVLGELKIEEKERWLSGNWIALAGCLYMCKNKIAQDESSRLSVNFCFDCLIGLTIFLTGTFEDRQQ